MSRKPRIAIAGGGIGGVALAASLRLRGFEPHIFERASGFGEIGAGVQITPNAVKILRELGLYDKLTEVAFQPQASVGRNWKTGRQTFRTSYDQPFLDIYKAPYLQIHRADLMELLASSLPDNCVSFGRDIIGCENSDDGAVLSFADGSTFEADLVVGADGVRSVVRDKAFGASNPRWTGHMCYRALVPLGGQVDYVGPYNSLWMGRNSHVVTYYVRGGKMVNIVAVLEAKDWVDEGWNVRASRDELLNAFQGWHPDVLRLFSQVTDTFRWGLFDRDPMIGWNNGRITLLGDAAHPMLPFLSQGAAMSIEDAYVLAGALAATPLDIPTALERYDAARRPRTSRVQLESRKRGETYHLPSAFAQMRRDLEYRLRSVFAPQTSGIRADWVYEYDGVAAVQAFR